VRCRYESFVLFCLLGRRLFGCVISLTMNHEFYLCMSIPSSAPNLAAYLVLLTPGHTYPHPTQRLKNMRSARAHNKRLPPSLFNYPL
jgi:hypothetical protein